jgi:phosphate transport system permease protein
MHRFRALPMTRDTIAHTAFFSAAWLSAACTLMVFGFMAVLGYPILRNGLLSNMLSGSWSPIHQSYGIQPMIVGTLGIAFLGLAMAAPLSLGCAVLIQVVAPRGVGRLLHTVVRWMTGIPTVVYGFVGIFLLVPLIRQCFGHGSGLCMLSAALMLALIIAPTMILFFVQGLAQVPPGYLTAAKALGATPIQRLVYIMLPNAWRSLSAGLMLAFGRAVGDTMIALMLAGNAVARPHSVLDSTRTLTGHIALVIAADFDSPEFRSLFLCGLILYVFTLTATLAVRYAVPEGKP